MRRFLNTTQHLGGMAARCLIVAVGLTVAAPASADDPDPASLALAEWRGPPQPVVVDWLGPFRLPVRSQRTQYFLLLDRSALQARSEFLDLRLVVDDIHAAGVPEIDMRVRFSGVIQGLTIDAQVRDLFDGNRASGPARDPAHAQRRSWRGSDRYHVGLRYLF